MWKWMLGATCSTRDWIQVSRIAGGFFTSWATKEGASQVVLVVKNPLTNAGNIRHVGLIPGSGRSPGGGHGHPLQYSCLENPMDRGSWRATVHRITKSHTQRLSIHTHAHVNCISIKLGGKTWLYIYKKERPFIKPSSVKPFECATYFLLGPWLMP